MLDRWQATIVDEKGNIRPGAIVQIRSETTGAIATVFKDPDGTEPWPTGFVTADENGYVYFHARPDWYRLTSFSPAIDWRFVNVGARPVQNTQQTFLTYADMQAFTPEESPYFVQVTNDPDEDLNGYYVWDGSAWERSGIQPLNAVDVQRAIVQSEVGAKGIDSRNLFSPAELAFEDRTRFSASSSQAAATFEREPTTGRMSLKFVSTFGGTAGRSFLWSFPIAEFGPVRPAKISAAATCIGVTGTGAARRLELVQLNASNTEIVVTPAQVEVRPDKQIVKVGPVALDPTTTTVYLRGLFSAYTVWVNDMAIAGDVEGDFTDPVPQADVFPDPKWNGYKIVTEVGALDVSGGNLVKTYTAPGTSVDIFEEDAVQGLAPGAVITMLCRFWADAAASSAIGQAMVFLDAARAEISRVENTTSSSADINVMQSVRIRGTVPPNTRYVRFWVGKRANATTVKHLPPKVYTNLLNAQKEILQAFPYINFDRTVVVASTGSDTAYGSRFTPMKTLQAALLNPRLLNGGEIWIADSAEYAQGTTSTAITNKFGPLFIGAYSGESPLLTCGTKLSSITKTGGYSKVYQCSLVATPTAGGRLYEHLVPDQRTAIAISDRLALQKGRATRNPSSAINAAASIADIDAAPDDDPRWFWTGGTLYFSIYGGGDATAADIRVPFSNSLLINSVPAGMLRLEMANLQFLYGRLNLANLAALKMWDVMAGASNTGELLSYDNCGHIETWNLECWGSANDGANGHDTRDPNRCQSQVIHNHPWLHDNIGDGESDHENFLSRMIGGLLEFNGKAGMVPANGCHATAHGVIARNNGLLVPNGGGGFAITNAVLERDKGIGTQFDLFDCVSIGNPYNFMCGPDNIGGGGTGGQTDVNHRMTLTNCASIDASIAGYFARVGGLIAINSTHMGTGLAKQEKDGGVITVHTGTLLAA